MASILFVDDEPLTLKLLSQAASILGHQALTSSTVEEALSIAAIQQPDLIVTDINLSGHTSWDFIESLHTGEDTRGIPVVTLSALEPSEVEQQSRERGAVASLAKPIRLQTLLEVIGEYTK
jgi:CheY-like chemotaxis protein